MKINVDIETFSSEDIRKTGLYRYALSKDFDILLFGFSIDNGPVRVLDCTRANDRRELQKIAPMLWDHSVIKRAFNAAFEWYCLSVYLNRTGLFNGLLPIDQWRDTQLEGQYCGYPSSLDGAGSAIGLPEDKRKLTTGKALIRTFCSPRKPSKRDQRTRVMPEDEPEKWELFKEYNAGDVVAEQEIERRLSKWPVPEFVQKQWELDTILNATGVNVDMDLVNGALQISEQNTQELLDEAAKITGLSNPNSRDQLQAWLTEEIPDADIPNLRKDTVSALLSGISEDKIRRVLEIRQETGKAAHKKYGAIKRMVCEDGRLRGLMKFYGANRTGRWASVGVQLQNLARTHLSDTDLARSIVKRGDLNALRFAYGNVSDTLGQLVRSALIPSQGNMFVDVDFSAIEARVIAWLAGEDWVLDVFRTHGKIYEATASQMFGVPMEKIKKGNPEYELRQRGKVATLACIAEGSMVPVKMRDGSIREIPIETVSSKHLVWDGNGWVRCRGSVFNGYKEVITYEGLTATPDHLVWVEGKYEPIPFGLAAKSGSHLLQSHPSRYSVRMGKNHKPGETVYERVVSMLRAGKMHGLWTGVVDLVSESDARTVKRLSTLFSAATDTTLAEQKNNSPKTEMPEPERPGVQRVRRPGDRVQIQLSNRVRAVFNVLISENRSKLGNRQNQYQRSLRTRESAYDIKEREPREPKNYDTFRVGPAILAVFGNLHKTKAVRRNVQSRDHSRRRKSGSRETKELARDKKTVRVYDILNAGPNHRYTVQGVLVHNCGYQGGAHAMEAMDINHSIDPKLYPDLVKQWRQANPAIVKYWYNTERAALDALKTGSPQKVGYCTYALESDERTNQWFLTCLLPSGRKLFYVRPTICENRFGKEAIRFWGINDKKKWAEIDTYGGRLVENQCQSVARDCLADKLPKLYAAGYPTPFTIHDEAAADVPREKADLEKVKAIMSAPIDWAPGLPLNADGWVGEYFRKD